VDTLAGVAIGLMAAVLRPLGSLLTTLPLGPEHPGELAGPAFYMVHPSQFLLPYRQAAWKVMTQRLDAMADGCVRLGREPGLAQVADLEGPVRGIAARLQAPPGRADHQRDQRVGDRRAAAAPPLRRRRRRATATWPPTGGPDP
jgi:hypothetical protein